MARHTSHEHRILVIGFGSPLRGDDAAGYVLAGELDEEKLPGLTCIAAHQLTPDLARQMADYPDVIFIDAYRPSGSHADLRQIRLIASSADSPATHACTPEALLALSERLYHACPHASLIGIPARDFSLSDQLSELTRAGINLAKEAIRQRVAIHA